MAWIRLNVRHCPLDEFAKRCLIEMSNLWHLSRTAVAGLKEGKNHGRYLWCAEHFAKEHPEFTRTSAYKAFDRMLCRYPLSNDDATIKFINQVVDEYDRKGRTNRV